MNGYEFTVQPAEGDDFKRYLQAILNRYHQAAYPLMEVPESKKFILRVADEHGALLGGALFWTYWGWVDVSLVALIEEQRGKGLGRRIVQSIEEKGRQQGCTRLRVECFGSELGFYQKLGFRVVGQLDDYPAGYCYYWLRKEL